MFDYETDDENVKVKKKSKNITLHKKQNENISRQPIFHIRSK